MRLLTFLLFCACLHARQPHPYDSGYDRWLADLPVTTSDTSQKLYNNLVAFSGDRRAGHHQEALAPAATEPHPSVLGNWDVGLALESAQGLGRLLAVQGPGLSGGGLKLQPKGMRLNIGKRLAQGRRHTFHANLTLRNLQDARDQQTGLYTLNTGEVVNIPYADNNLRSALLDLLWKKRARETWRHSLSFIAGARLIRSEADLTISGTNAGLQTKTDWDWVQTAIGPFFGFSGEIPLGADAHFGLDIRHGILFSEGRTSYYHSKGPPLVDTISNVADKSSSYTFSDASLHFAFFTQRNIRANLGYAWSKQNLSRTAFIGSAPLENLNIHGPTASINFLF